MFTSRVDRYGQIAVRANRYSVPVRLIGKRVRVLLHASHLVVYDKNVELTRHERLIAKGSCRLELDHYLEALVRRPGAFPGATALDQARSAGKRGAGATVSCRAGCGDRDVPPGVEAQPSSAGHQAAALGGPPASPQRGRAPRNR